ncbi:hypothetical protein BegalDRAFT_2779 [Beggiatoa alba B18LD]|uniref:Uncharacterized protein n=1 Tax=Beggiatoa alba B18LD TaxID=395493 RepID=I3CJ21_9GAMM|nr:hypothetical protein [Beggiatoa alba]EIJ43614.1 hypothetical protein BegalDRAFT_2779 [Beggiatoa alba B18LD]
MDSSGLKNGKKINWVYYVLILVCTCIFACSEIVTTPVVQTTGNSHSRLTPTQYAFNQHLRNLVNQLDIGDYDHLPLGFGYVEPRDLGAEHDSWLVFDHNNAYFQAVYQQAQRQFGTAPINLICAVIPSYLRAQSRPSKSYQPYTFIGSGNIASKNIYRSVRTRPIRYPRDLAVGDWVFAFKSGEVEPHHTMVIAERGGELVIIGFTGTTPSEPHPRRRLAALQILPVSSLFMPYTQLRAFKGNLATAVY